MSGNAGASVTAASSPEGVPGQEGGTEVEQTVANLTAAQTYLQHQLPLVDHQRPSGSRRGLSELLLVARADLLQSPVMHDQASMHLMVSGALAASWTM